MTNTPPVKHDSSMHKKPLATTKEVMGYTVRKLKLVEYATLMDKLGSIPYIVSQIEGIGEGGNDLNQLFKVLPEIARKAVPEVTEIISMLTNTKVEQLNEELDLLTAVEILKAGIEVNGFLEVYSSLKEISEKAKGNE